MTIHECRSSEEAYDLAQGLPKGDILLIESEGVVGISWAWPIAITVENGELHETVDDNPTKFLKGEGLASNLVEAHALALDKGFALRT